MSETNSAMTLGKRSLMGLVLGLIAGGVLYFVPECWLRNDFLIDTVFKIVGNGYLNLKNDYSAVCFRVVGNGYFLRY